VILPQVADLNLIYDESIPVESRLHRTCHPSSPLVYLHPVASIGNVSLVCKHRQSKQEQFRANKPSLRSSKNAWRDATCWWYSVSSRVKSSLKPHSPRFTLGHTTGTAATNKDYGYLHRYYGSAKADGNLWQGCWQAHL
jgi:hypothetical protein